MTLQPEIITDITLKTLFYVTDMRFPRTLLPNPNEDVRCNFGKLTPENEENYFICN